MNSRNYSFDFARAICVIWIVGFWHILNYFPPEWRLSGKSLTICYSFTTSVLACFAFLSGYFLKKYVFASVRDVYRFYVKRLIRFYPLFVSAVALSVLGGVDIKQGILAIVGLSMFFPPPIGTLWFFSMLLFFYVLTPILKIKWDNTVMVIISICVVLIVMIGGFFVADRRLILYFPFYVLGLNLPDRFVEKHLNLYVMIVAFISFICFSLWNVDNVFFRIMKALAGATAILSFAKKSYRSQIQGVVSFFAYASMCAYLFHRPLYTAFLSVLRFFNHQYYSITFAILAFISVFIFAYYIQKIYDSLINRLIKNNKTYELH